MSQEVALHQSKPETTPRQAQMAEEDDEQLTGEPLGSPFVFGIFNASKSFCA